MNNDFELYAPEWVNDTEIGFNLNSNTLMERAEGQLGVDILNVIERDNKDYEPWLYLTFDTETDDLVVDYCFFTKPNVMCGHFQIDLRKSEKDELNKMVKEFGAGNILDSITYFGSF